MGKARQVSLVAMLALVVLLLFLASNTALGEAEPLSPDQYMDKYEQLKKDGASAAERVSLLEEGLGYYPAFRSMRYKLLVEYLMLDDDEKAKRCVKEALQYEPQSAYYADMYRGLCDLRESPEEAEAAAKHVLALCESKLPPAGEKAILNENYDINSYDYLHYCMSAHRTLFQIYDWDDTKSVLECGDWILSRKDDSEFGYDNGLYVMGNLAIHYGNLKQFDEMKKWLDQYLAFEATADEKGDAYMQIRLRLEKVTKALAAIKEAYLAYGSDIDVQALLDENMQK